MRFAIIGLMSLLLVPPALGSQPPRHGDIVHYQAHNGPQGSKFGIVVGSHDLAGHYKISPIKPVELTPNLHHVVNAPAGHVNTVGIPDQRMASDIQRFHRSHPPEQRYAAGPVEGSADYKFLHPPPGGHYGSMGTTPRGRRRR
ncbi:hypothetical protein M378DRAFT_165156 [Amanita muscaria Koide BX008]|uniref:Uncharacterized protein n=1 Tax=Amanita muscaria (strain Koide BX008) TaxID=946122 RepID=A0A0C2T8D0_AMAMK|nr:hypothetical protein M378DRAFT_165156 [Amanita muscaria Koide BX008]